MKCPVCGGTRRSVLLERERVPVFQNALAATADAARAMPTGRLRLMFCEDCTFIANDAFEAALVAYGAGYENDQSCSPAFQAHLESLIDSLVGAGVTGKRILEIGCGNGGFLRRLCQAGANTGTGYDPAYRAADSPSTGPVRFVADYFRGQQEAADVIISRHVIEHVADPASFLRLLRGAVGPMGRLFLETPAVEWILDGVIVQDFFYEHCSYFSAASLTFAVKAAGFEVQKVSTIFGGQYLWLEGRAADDVEAEVQPAARSLVDAVRRYGTEVGRRLSRLEGKLLELRGPVAVWGAGAKGVTLVNLLDPTQQRIACLVDVNPRKQGHFVPGTGHAVVPPEAISGLGVRTILVMNPNYKEEIARQAKVMVSDIALQTCDEIGEVTS